MENAKRFTATFWGVRGSIPAPISPEAIKQKFVKLLQKLHTDDSALDSLKKLDYSRDDIRKWLEERFAPDEYSTFGGETTCVEVRCDDDLIILDMGTGLRKLGGHLMPQTLKDKGIRGTILQSHVHWDHIQGYPFWPQLYLPRKKFTNEFTFFGGKEWDRSLEEVLRGQMNPPMFPVEHRELEQTALRMNFNTVFDGKEITIEGTRGPISILCRKLNHPQETYGYRIEYGGRVLTFCTDHEPYAAGPPEPLLELARNADVFITDCQYTHSEYAGKERGVQKLGWGHSFPEYIAVVGGAAGVKRIYTTHHDPDAPDKRILNIAESVRTSSRIPTIAANEGMTIDLNDDALPL